jgi:hypothetical protein
MMAGSFAYRVSFGLVDLAREALWYVAETLAIAPPLVLLGAAAVACVGLLAWSTVRA